MDKAAVVAMLTDTYRPATPALKIGVLLADARYLSNDNLAAPGPDRLIAVGKHRELAAAAREHPTTEPQPRGATSIGDGAPATYPRVGMPATPSAATSPKPRSPTPNITSGSATSLERIKSATAELSFHALVHNLFKAIGTGYLTPAAC